MGNEISSASRHAVSPHARAAVRLAALARSFFIPWYLQKELIATSFVTGLCWHPQVSMYFFCAHINPPPPVQGLVAPAGGPGGKAEEKLGKKKYTFSDISTNREKVSGYSTLPI